MHTIEPYYSWRYLYIASEDPQSPFYGHQNSELYFTDQIYNFLIHPQWDSIESESLFLGEWNDLLNNDIMTLKRGVIELMIEEGITKYILICENVLNFHTDLDVVDYYEEWQDELEEGWIAVLNARDHVLAEMSKVGIDQYLVMGGKLNDLSWRIRHPKQLFYAIDTLVRKRLGN